MSVSEARFETLPEMKLVGKRLKMSFAQNKTMELWQSFMPKRVVIRNSIGTELYSLEVYPDPTFLDEFDPTAEFEKWAAIQVENFDGIPDGLESLIVPEGKYAIFTYKGSSSEAPKAYQFIYGNWIPNSVFTLDDRPHFALMGEKYKNADPDSEEEIWIPVKS